MEEQLKKIIESEPQTPYIFTEQGYSCIINRIKNGTLNGYVGIPKEHPLYEKKHNSIIVTNKTPNFEKLNAVYQLIYQEEKTEENEQILCTVITVHGGITYSDKYNPISRKSDDLWWFGFDTQHAGDLVPIQPKPNPSDPLYELNKQLIKLTDILKIKTGVIDTYRDFNYVMKNVKHLVKEMIYYE